MRSRRYTFEGGRPLVERVLQIDAYRAARAKKERRCVHGSLVWAFGGQSTDVPPALVRTAVRIHQAMGAPPPGTPSEVYLCHTLCELGAVKMSKVARQIRAFLDEHPAEVLVLVIEDHVSPARKFHVAVYNENTPDREVCARGGGGSRADPGRSSTTGDPLGMAHPVGSASSAGSGGRRARAKRRLCL
jgi:hypothetical protein